MFYIFMVQHLFFLYLLFEVKYPHKDLKISITCHKKYSLWDQQEEGMSDGQKICGNIMWICEGKNVKIYTFFDLNFQSHSLMKSRRRKRKVSHEEMPV